jgi:hypothetical protein
MFDKHHGPIGWAKEAWLAEQERRGGSNSIIDEDMRLTEEQIVDVLKPWVASHHSHMCDVKHIKECLLDLGEGRAVNLQRFSYLCSKLVAMDEMAAEKAAEGLPMFRFGSSSSEAKGE